MTERRAGSRHFKLSPNGGSELLPEMQGDEYGFDVTAFNTGAGVQRFTAEGTPQIDEFYLATRAWELIGKPERIKVTVEAVRP